MNFWLIEDLRAAAAFINISQANCSSKALGLYRLCGVCLFGVQDPVGPPTWSPSCLEIALKADAKHEKPA
jgi:hypothetical protein